MRGGFLSDFKRTVTIERRAVSTLISKSVYEQSPAVRSNVAGLPRPSSLNLVQQINRTTARPMTTSYSFSPDNSSAMQLVKNRVYVFFQGQNIIRISRALFESCEEQTYMKEWYSRGKLATTFRDKHILLVIHIWMCHRRLVCAYANGEDVRADRLQECLFDLLWDDSTTRISEANVSSLFINKYLKQVQTLSFHICHELDTALSTPFTEVGPVEEGQSPNVHTEEEMVEVALSKIGEVMWNHVFDSNPNMEESHVLELARYILVEQHRIQTLPYEQFIKGDLQWSPVPIFEEPSRPGVKAGKGPGRLWKPLAVNKKE